MKVKGYILFFTVLVFSQCSKTPIGKESSSAKDSLKTYLSYANSDSLPLNERLKFNKKALAIVETEDLDSLRFAGLFKVANRFYNVGELGDYKRVSQNILIAAQKVDDTINVAKALLYLGDYYKNSVQSDSAIYYYDKASKFYRRLQSADDLANINLKKAEVYWNENDYSSSEFASLEALKFLRQSKDKQQVFEALTMLGLVSNARNDYDRAIEYLNKALEVVSENNLQYNDPRATTLNNIGNVYQNAKQNSLAIENFETALDDRSLKNNNPSLYAILLDNLAYSKFKLNPGSREIVPLFQQSISIKDSLNFTAGIIFTKCRLSEYYFEIGKKEDAVALAKEALALSEKNENATTKLTPLKQLSAYDSENSRLYSAEYIKINDSVQQAERRIQDKFARIQFETDEISLQKDKLEAKNRTLLLVFLGTVMIGLLLFVIRTQRAKNRELLLKQAQQKANEDIYNLMLAQQNKIEEGRIREKKRIAQELHDGVLSRLFGARLNLDSLNKMDGSEATDKRNNYLVELKNIEQDIREISHDLNREKFVLINNFVAILANLLEEQAANFTPEVETEIDEDIPWEKVGNTLKINIYRIVQEALQNVNKYANATKIKVLLEAQGSNLRLEVSDNGQGFSVSKKSKGIGLSNMVSRAEECDGQLEIKSKRGKGTTISITFPTENTPTADQPVVSGQPVIA
ncbi:sensor histidine kinase [Flavobacterium sp. MAH-1]|uniref:Oxygen sensor histidine kinase NreB n=1 Tax=Flavobacterium agri TaxID=2743471 RepID=A0A7Y8Y2P2_9FLAO|nr:ATP-binding protein [Flavobacterium agri]NUY81352.1 sensor histidine kinase [Flavobacterium agri]NYA71376.1 sensor histidine kinase [Flavobacterium agri]